MSAKRISKKSKTKKHSGRKSLPKKLKYKESAAIVRHAIRTHPMNLEAVELQYVLGDVLLTSKDRVLFRKTIHRLASSRGFELTPASIPIERHLKLRDVARALTFAGLPGKHKTRPPL